jgi:hypothetical protein
MDLVMCHCRHTRCTHYGKMSNASALLPYGSDRGEGHWRCMACGEVVSARTETASAGIRPDLTQYALGAKRLAEGLGVRATVRSFVVDKDTVNAMLTIKYRWAYPLFTSDESPHDATAVSVVPYRGLRQHLWMNS